MATLIISASKESKATELINSYFYSTTCYLKDGKLFNSNGIIRGFHYEVKKGRYKIYRT